MATTGFVEVNGVQYELWSLVEDSQVEQLKMRLAPTGTVTAPAQTIAVRIKAVEVGLTIRTDRLWALAVWRATEHVAPPEVVVQTGRRRGR